MCLQVLEYIKAENEYCQAVMADTVGLQDKLFKEMKGRIQEEDCSVPVRDSGYYYYTRTLEGKQYGVHCRRKIPEREDGEIVDEETTMDTRCVTPQCTDAHFLRLVFKFRLALLLRCLWIRKLSCVHMEYLLAPQLVCCAARHGKR